MVKPTRRQKKKIRELMESLDWFFGVSNQERHLLYAKDANPDSTDCAADISITEDYQRIYVTIYPHFWDHNEERQREFLTHEYSHYLIQPIQRIARELQEGRLHTKEDITGATEKATSSVAIMIDALLSGGRRYMIKAYKEYLPKKKKAKKPLKRPGKKAK